MRDLDPTNNERLDAIMPEISPELAATYESKRPEITYLVGCGDDRGSTAESQAALVEQGAASTEAGIRYYGALSGVARVLATTLIAQGRQRELARLGDSFTEVIKTVKNDVEAACNVTLGLHSAEDNEGNPEHFEPQSDKGVGCAYGANAGAIAEICATDPRHAEVTRSEGTALFDTGSTIETVRDANRQFAQSYFSDPAIAGLSRSDFANSNAPIQILKGAHAQPAMTRAIVNFTADKISNANEAARIGQPSYNNDVTQVAEMLIRTYPDFELSPEMLLAVMDQDIRATRAALAGGDPSALKQERLGNPKDALEYLQSVQETLGRS